LRSYSSAAARPGAATKITVSNDKKRIELENYGTQPVLLQYITREAVR
jgi:hypothetical protein